MSGNGASSCCLCVFACACVRGCVWVWVRGCVRGWLCACVRGRVCAWVCVWGRVVAGLGLVPVQLGPCVPPHLHGGG